MAREGRMDTNPPPESTMTRLQVLGTWMFSQGSDEALPVTAGRAKRENGGLGEDPPGSTITHLQVRAVHTDVVKVRAKQATGVLGG